MYIVDFVKRLIRKSNTLVIIYLAINILIYVTLFGGFINGYMAIIAIALYFGTLCIALSPVGEFIVRKQNGCRNITRIDYLNRLMPLFGEVYTQAKAKDPSIPDNVQLYLSEDRIPSAFAVGRKTICVTEGLLVFSDAQIKGAFAHEFAHLAHKDTDLTLFILVGNMLMTIIFIIWKVIIYIFAFFFASVVNMRFIGSFLTYFFIDLLLTFIMWVWTKLGMMLVMHSSRQNEYEADKFAYEMGYGKNLYEILVRLGSFSITNDRSLLSQLYSSHPPINDRIARLQELSAVYANPSHNGAVTLAGNSEGASHSGNRICANCGALISNKGKFCSRCGTPIG